MADDFDMKIAGERPSDDIKRRQSGLGNGLEISAELTKKAKAVGKTVAESYMSDVLNQDATIENGQLILQRKLLLSFTATIGFEQYIKNDSLSGVAQKSFLDTIKSADRELYKSSSDTGAFSFYYLAFRRGNDIERRMGQTFAMLCSHDGDPIFEELGEALFCWFSSVVRKAVESADIYKNI